MKRIGALLLAASLIASMTAMPAHAGDRGAAVAAGVVGGLAIGALIGSAATSRAAPTYVYSYDDFPPPRVVHRRYRAYDYDVGYGGGYDHGYASGYRDGYSDGAWDGY